MSGKTAKLIRQWIGKYKENFFGDFIPFNPYRQAKKIYIAKNEQEKAQTKEMIKKDLKEN